MRYAKTIIESRCGALGALALLQTYGLLLAYFFACAIRHISSSSTLYDLPGHLFEVGIGLTFLAVFIYAQGKLLGNVIAYIRNARDVRGWIHDIASIQGILRCLLTVCICVLYFALLFGKVTLNFPKLSIFILVGYQAFHPIASFLVARKISSAEYRTETKYVSGWYQMFGILMATFAGGVFYWFSVWMKKDDIPAYWLFQMMGIGIVVFGLAGFLLEDIKGRTREVVIEDENQ